jgi:hypothetical protein
MIPLIFRTFLGIFHSPFHPSFRVCNQIVSYLSPPVSVTLVFSLSYLAATFSSHEQIHSYKLYYYIILCYIILYYITQPTLKYVWSRFYFTSAVALIFIACPSPIDCYRLPVLAS